MPRITISIRRMLVKPIKTIDPRVAYIPGNYLRIKEKSIADRVAYVPANSSRTKESTLLTEICTLVPLIVCGASIVYLIT